MSTALRGAWKRRMAEELGLPPGADIRIGRSKATSSENFTHSVPWLLPFVSKMRQHGIRWNKNVQITQNPTGGIAGYRLVATSFIQAGSPLITVPKNCRLSVPAVKINRPYGKTEPPEFALARNLLGFLNMENRTGVWEPSYCEFLFNRPPDPEGRFVGSSSYYQGLAVPNLPYFTPLDLCNKHVEKQFHWYSARHKQLTSSVASHSIPHCHWATSVAYSRSHLLPFGEGSEGHILCPFVDCLRHHFDGNCKIDFAYSYPSFVLEKLRAEEKEFRRIHDYDHDYRVQMKRKRGVVFREAGIVPTTLPPEGGEQPSFLNVISRKDIPKGQTLNLCYSTIGTDGSRSLRDPTSDASQFWKQRYGFVPEDPTKGRARNAPARATREEVVKSGDVQIETAFAASSKSPPTPPGTDEVQTKEVDAEEGQKKAVNENLMDILGLK